MIRPPPLSNTAARLEMRRQLKAALVKSMRAAVEGEWIDEANVCLEALCWVARLDLTGAIDQGREVTHKERDAVVEAAFEPGEYEFRDAEPPP